MNDCVIKYLKSKYLLIVICFTPFDRSHRVLYKRMSETY